jgi:4-amino-4-deoxy-L-arabinose transferase-like glycosyltransferase
MTDVTARPAAAFRREVAALQLLVGLFLALRLYFDINADLVGDEAYYWMWGQHLGWSYFDHPPLHAWLLRLVSIVFGWHNFSMRLLTWLSLGLVFWVIRRWAVRLAPADPSLWFWRAAAIYLASPLLFGMTSIAYNDHLLVAFSLAAVHCFLIFTGRREEGTGHALRWLYLAALALGLAALSKYTGVFVGLGFAAMFLLRPRLRPMLATPHPWLAGLLALAMQAPVLYWNLIEGGASFRYHLAERWGSAPGLHWNHALTFTAFSLLAWSPLLIWPLIVMIRSTPLNAFEERAKSLTLAIFVISSVAMLAIAVALNALFYWNIVAFACVTPLLVRHLRAAWLRALHLAFGMAAIAALTVNFAVVPIAQLAGAQDNATAINYGWSEVADHLRAAEAVSPTDTIGSTRFSTTSQVGFALGIADPVRYLPDLSQYSIWQEGLPLAGKSALILVDDHDGDKLAAELSAHFATLAEFDRFNITRFGKPTYAWRIYRGDGYRP